MLAGDSTTNFSALNEIIDKTKADKVMKRNVGKTDMIIRIIIGIVMATLGFVYQSWWGMLAIIPMATAFIRFCGLYAILGIKTCSIEK
jgi:hypothetical protein